METYLILSATRCDHVTSVKVFISGKLLVGLPMHHVNHFAVLSEINETLST